ncbi:hypothetical protein CYMTET_22993 [Cymbomonas tetramitiformis]|uniref:Uncharacterized protein n=1 Tax=Cymbomonas tetramitiformis TaxID=36881 RepID=A0AAE0FZ45_9CHLO|nr:hypothetical protein CYMTET_22993 [Cymbomonas tetramitiformis]
MTSDYAEFQPYYGPTDEVEAGRVWRLEKLKDFEWKAKCAGIQDDPEVVAILEEMRRETAELEKISEKEKEEGGAAHWWCDGEYDDVRADEANDQGTRSYKNKEYGIAFDDYTEAIRLCPSKAVYHCNRAAAALKLGRNDIAALDAEYAIQRDAGNLRAYLRGGKASTLNGRPERAAELYRRALELNPGNESALEGLSQAELAAEAKAAAKAAEAASAQRGERAALPLHSLAEAAAADLLHAAQEMLRSSPDKEALKCAHVEALIHCSLLCALEVQTSVDSLLCALEVQTSCDSLLCALEVQTS